MNKSKGLRRRRIRAGFSLIETLIAVSIVAIVGMGLIAGIIYSREIAEYDKQRMAAIAAARRYMEEHARHDPFPEISALNDVTLDNFNTPEESDDMQATVSMEIYNVNNDGSRGSEITSSPTADDRVEVVVIVEWNRAGRRSGKRVSEELSTYVAPDI